METCTSSLGNPNLVIYLEELGYLTPPEVSRSLFEIRSKIFLHLKGGRCNYNTLYEETFSRNAYCAISSEIPGYILMLRAISDVIYLV